MTDSSPEQKILREAHRLAAAIPMYSMADDDDYPGDNTLDVKPFTCYMRELSADKQLVLAVAYERLMGIFKLMNSIRLFATYTAYVMSDTAELMPEAVPLSHRREPKTYSRPIVTKPGGRIFAVVDGGKSGNQNDESKLFGDLEEKLFRIYNEFDRESNDFLEGVHVLGREIRADPAQVVLSHILQRAFAGVTDFEKRVKGDKLTQRVKMLESKLAGVQQGIDLGELIKRVDALELQTPTLVVTNGGDVAADTRALEVGKQDDGENPAIGIQQFRDSSNKSRRRTLSYCALSAVAGIAVAITATLFTDRFSDGPTTVQDMPNILTISTDGQRHLLGLDARYTRGMPDTLRLHPDDGEEADIKVFSDEQNRNYLYTISIKRDGSIK